MTKEQLFAEAMSLHPPQRAELAEELWFSLDQTSREEVGAAWMDEARRRDAAFASGKSQASPMDEVLARLATRAQVLAAAKALPQRPRNADPRPPAVS